MEMRWASSVSSELGGSTIHGSGRLRPPSVVIGDVTESCGCLQKGFELGCQSEHAKLPSKNECFLQ